MSDVLVDYRPEIPSVLYNALSTSVRPKFQPIERLEECSEMEDFTKSIFELAMVSANCALELLKCGFEHLPADIDRVVVADALLSSVKSDTHSKTIQKLVPVVEVLLYLLVETTAKRQFNILGGEHANIKKLEIIELFFQAVKLYIINNLNGEDKLSEEKFKGEAAVILQSFCENTLNWLIIDLAPLKDSKLVFSLNEAGGAAEEQVIQVLSNLQKLLYNINFLERRLCSLPISVRNVYKEILAFFNHLYREFFGSSFDAVNEQRKTLENRQTDSSNGNTALQILNNVQNFSFSTARKNLLMKHQAYQRRPIAASNSDRKQPIDKEENEEIQIDANRPEGTNSEQRDAKRHSKWNKHKNKKRHSKAAKPEGELGVQPPETGAPN